MDVYFPDVGPLQAINNGQLTATSVNPNYIPLVFQTRAGAALQFQDFEQWQTAVDLAQKFFDPLYKRAREYLNGQIAALITTTNFNSNAAIVGATQGEVGVTDQLQAWDVLADQKVPLEDSDKLRLMVHNNVYRRCSATRPGCRRAWSARPSRRRPAKRPTSATPSTSSRSGISRCRARPARSSTARSPSPTARPRSPGSNTAFTTDLTAGNYLTFGNDSTKTPVHDQLDHQRYRSRARLDLRRRDRQPSTAAPRLTAGRHRVRQLDHATVTKTNVRSRPLKVGDWLYDVRGRGHRRARRRSRPSAQRRPPPRSPAAPTTAYSSSTLTKKSYTNLALHEYAIALALRPIATPDEARNVVDVTYIDLQGIPLRVMVSYVHIYQALFVTVDFGYALGVIRPDFGVIINC